MEVLASYPQHHQQLRASLSSDLAPRCLFGVDAATACGNEERAVVQRALTTESVCAEMQDDSTVFRSEGECQEREIKEERDSDAGVSISASQNKISQESQREKEHSQIAYLLKSLPDLSNFFDLHRKIGEGTFSSVFLASLKNIPSGSPLASRQFAIKHLIPTTHPSRAERELRCLQEIGGCDNVVGIHLCLRNQDSIAFIMPYLPHRRFSEYVIEMGVTETRNYMKQLLLALRRVHSFNIIHRDVKPSNFLYDREARQFLLVDFGLSQPVEESSTLPSSNPVPSLNPRKRKREAEYLEQTKGSPCAELNENVAKRPVLAPRNSMNIMKTPEKTVKISSDNDNGTPVVSSNRNKGLQNITNMNGHGIGTPKTGGMSLGLKRLIKSPTKEAGESSHCKKTPRKNKGYANNENIPSPPKPEIRAGLKKTLGFGLNEIYRDGSSPTNYAKCALDLRKYKSDVEAKPSGLQRKIIFDDCPEQRQKVDDVKFYADLPLLSPKYQPVTRRSWSQMSRNSLESPFPVSGVYSPSAESESLASPILSPTDQNMGYSKEFRTLVPECGKDLAPGSSVVRVQNSQVKSQQLSPITPSESRKLGTQPTLQKLDRGKGCNAQNIVFAKPQVPSANGSVHRTSTPSSPRCNCHGRPQICSVCLARKPINAPRAGTPGFRPPEVLLRSPLQSTAVDMWAVGVILLCILSGCYPFFRSPDDLTALAEIMTIFGTDKIKATAVRLGRLVVCSQPNSPLDLKKLCTRMRQRRKVQSAAQKPKEKSDEKCTHCRERLGILDSCLCQENPRDALLINSSEVNNVEESDDVFPDSAYHLLARLLDLNADTRITAAQALNHPFVSYSA